MANLISVNLASYKQYRDEALSHLAQIGVRHVEISAPPLDKVDEVQARLQQYGLSASTLMAPINLQSERCADEFEGWLPVAQRMGVQVLFVSAHAGELSREIAYARLREVGDRAARYGVTVALETHPDLCTNAEEMLRTMNGVNHPNVRINFDTANIYYYNEGLDAVTELRKVADFVVSVHLKDTNGGYRTWFFPALGEGIVDFPSVFRLLNERGFTGPFTLEIEGVEGEQLTKGQVFERVAKSLDYLRRIGAW